MATGFVPENLTSMFRMDGKTAVVFGGAGGLGEAIAKGLAAFGANVVIASRGEEKLQAAVKEIEAHADNGAKVDYVVCDATVDSQVENVLAETLKKFGDCQILVCSQGFNRKHDVVDFDMADFDAMLTTNVRSVFVCNKVFGKHFKEKGYGKIVDVTSVRDQIATFPGGGNAGYCATKGALTSIIKQCATELAPEVTVNGIGPTVTLTPMMEKIVPKQAQEVSIPADHPLGRMAKPEDIIGAAVYLCSDASCYHTGQVLYPDGGLLCKG